ncbi:MAG: DUF4411 family protein [Candidatus Pacebacteria bacterium]|nr:DUF4411 family protein [Candidatus Paceibacterota bacterium]
MNEEVEKTKYILDTNILIGFAVWCPISLNKSFWDKLAQSLSDGDWILLDVVVDEVLYNMELQKWCKEQERRDLVKSVSDEDKERAVEINDVYEMIDEETQNSTVDTYIIAYAEANKLGIFSQESPRRMSNNLYKIPDVCDELKIKRIKKPVVFLKGIGF